MSLADFLTDIRIFDQHLLATMAERMIAAQAYWADSLFAPDLIDMQDWQRQKADLLEKTLCEASHSKSTDWEQVLATISMVEDDPLFARMYKEPRQQ